MHIQKQRQQSNHEQLIRTLDEAVAPPTIDALRNTPPNESSVTIHVFGQELASCSVIEPDDDLWFVQHTRTLAYDN